MKISDVKSIATECAGCGYLVIIEVNGEIQNHNFIVDDHENYYHVECKNADK